MSSFFSKKIGAAAAASGLPALTAALSTHVTRAAASQNRSVIGSMAVSTESISESQAQEFSTAVSSLTTALETIASSMPGAAAFSNEQRNAAVAAGLMAGNVQAFINAPVRQDMVSNANQTVVSMEGLQDGFYKRSAAYEAYNEVDNRNAVVYSMAYNMRAARQDAFGEAFFPTIVVSPDNVGFGVSIRLVQVFNDFKRDISGALDNYKKQNIIRALADHTILKNEMTRLVPVHRAQSASNFVAAGDVAPAVVLLEGESINTAPLAVGKKFSLTAIGQTDTLIANGLMDPTDSIDPAITLRDVYVKFGAGATADVIRFNTLNLPLANFVAAPQGNYRLMTLSFTSESLLINKNTKRNDGSALQTLDDVVTSDFIVRLNLAVSGSVNIETGETTVFGNAVSVATVQNAVTGDFLNFTVAGAAKDVADAVAAGTIIGYDLKAFYTNANRRQRGQLLDVTNVTQLYAVPLRSPISALRPVTADGQSDTSDLAALITATQIRTSNAAVTALLEASTILNSYVDARDTAGVGPDVMGVGRHLVKPVYLSETLNMQTAINSLTSHERSQDMQAALVNKIRDMAYRMYRDSNFKAAADAMAGGQSDVPTVIIGTDQVLSRYLMDSGDFRTMGPDFNVKLVSTVDARMNGRIVVSFGFFDGQSENKPNALHFGNMAWKPELTLVLPISRNGQVSKELTVSPSFLHVVNLPVMGVLTVSGVSEVIANNVPLHAEII